MERGEISRWNKAAAAYSMRYDEPTGHGFSIHAFKEPMPSEVVLEGHEGWECHRRVPSFVVMRAILKTT